MALIVPHASQTGISAANAGRAAEYRSASAFMTPGQNAMPGALRTLAGGIDKLGGVLLDAEVARRNEAMELRLLQTAQMYQENMARADDKYQQEFQGENALDAEEQARERYASAMNAAMMPWKGNRAAGLYLQKNLGSVAVAGVNRMRDYRNRQQNVFFDETVKRQMALAGRMALDPRYSAEEVDAARRKAENLNVQFRLRQGLPAEGAIAENMANRRKDALARLDLDVASYIQNGDFAGAKAAIDKALHDPGAYATGGGSAFNRLEGERRTAGLVSAADVAPLESKIAVAENKLTISRAYQFLYPMNHEEALKYVADPDGQKALGLNAQQAESVSEMLHTQWTHMQALEKKERESYETDVMTKATNMALGADGQQADPVSALQMINESALDGKTKLELRAALQKGTIDQDDPAFVVGLKNRIAGGGQPVTEVELARGVAAAKLSVATKDKLVKLQESVAGPQGEIIKSAFRALDEAFKKSMTADGTPAQALAHFAAQNELRPAVAEGIEKGNILDLLNPQSKNYVLPGIMQRHQLSTSEQIRAMKDKFAGSGQSQAPQRKAGESITEYQRRISGGTQ